MTYYGDTYVNIFQKHKRRQKGV